MGDKALRKRQASWKQPVAEAATKTGPLADSAARLHQVEEDENALWLTTNEGPECALLDDMEFRINARVRLDLPVIQQGLCQHQRRQKSGGTAGARCLAQLGRARTSCAEVPPKLHDVGCPHHKKMPVARRSSDRREKGCPGARDGTAHGTTVDVDAWGQ